MNVQAYLDRIKFRVSHLKPDLETLSQLQAAHLMNIPFENLDIHYHHPIVLDPNLFFDKIITANRGGFCYELNGLFYELLRSVGFEVKQISARVYNDPEGYNPAYDHLALVVNIGGIEYLSDVGFGEFTIAPLSLAATDRQKDKRGDFIIDRYETDYYRVSRIKDEMRSPEYIFKNEACALEEFKDRCHYHQSDPSSHFMKKKIITRPTVDGRITLNDNQLKIRKKDTTEIVAIENEQAFQEALWQWFKVKL